RRTTRAAHTILLMEAGATVEQGSNEQLLAADAGYRRLYMSQFRGEDAEERCTAEVRDETEAEARMLLDEVETQTPAGQAPPPNEGNSAAAESGADRLWSASAADYGVSRCRRKWRDSLDWHRTS